MMKTHILFTDCTDIHTYIRVTDRSMLDTIALSVALQDNRIYNQIEFN